MNTQAVVVSEPGRLGLESVTLDEAGPDDVVVDVRWSGVSAGTERMLCSGSMPHFPGMGYPLVPGYESVGRITKAGAASGRSVGDWVFVPGASCYGPVRGLFGASARRLVTHGRRVVPIGSLGSDGCLLALAATAYRALNHGAADLVVGHGALGRLLALVNQARYGRWPEVWEPRAERRDPAAPYSLVEPGATELTSAERVVDASGDPRIVDQVVPVLARGGEIVLAGFYGPPVQFEYPSAFIKEITIRISAEFAPDDLLAVTGLATSGALDLSGIVTHEASPSRVKDAYETAFTDPQCMKLILDWNRET